MHVNLSKQNTTNNADRLTYFLESHQNKIDCVLQELDELCDVLRVVDTTTNTIIILTARKHVSFFHSVKYN